VKVKQVADQTYKKLDNHQNMAPKLIFPRVKGRSPCVSKISGTSYKMILS